MKHSDAQIHRRKGFSLIELLVVLGLVGMLMAIAAPSMFSLISSNTLTGEGTLLRNQLTLAQQTAVSMSADVEVRFFKFSEGDAAMTEDAFRAFQLFQYNVRGELIPMSSFFRIKAPAMVNEGMSTLLKSGGGTSHDKKFGFESPRTGRTTAPVGFGGAERETEYVAFRFRPDGSTDLPFRSGGNDTWYITLVQGEENLRNTNPSNFVCLQINPYNGQVSEFRP